MIAYRDTGRCEDHSPYRFTCLWWYRVKACWYMALSIPLMFCSYTSINVRVKYQTLEENLRADEQIRTVAPALW